MQISPPVTLQECRSRNSLPAIPAEVARLLQRGVRDRRMLFPQHGPPVMEERWEPVLPEDEHEERAAARYLATLNAALEPADRGALLSRILVLLSHYPARENPEQVEFGIAADWAEDLGSYPLWAIEAAAKAWRRCQRFRPQICEMISLCEEAAGELMRLRDRLRQVMESTCRAKTRPEIAEVVSLLTARLATGRTGLRQAQPDHPDDGNEL